MRFDISNNAEVNALKGWLAAEEIPFADNDENFNSKLEEE